MPSDFMVVLGHIHPYEMEFDGSDKILYTSMTKNNIDSLGRIS
jgi:hypothetical protein